MRVLSQKETFEQVHLDKKDLRILSFLVNNVRMPLTEIAHKVRLSRASVEYRLKKMKENELIVGSLTMTNLIKLGYNSYHLFIEPLRAKDEKILIERALKNPNVNALISYSGKFGLELSIIAKTPREFMAYSEELFSGLNINYSTSLILLDTIQSIILPKSFFKGIKPLEISNIQTSPAIHHFNLDETDLAILKKISNNAELSAIEISRQLNLSKDIVSYRLKQLLANQIILQFRPAINYSLLGLSVHTMLIKIEGNQNKDFEIFLKNSDSVLWAVKIFGDWQYLLYLIVNDNEDLHHFIQEIKTQFVNLLKSYELLFAYKEYKYSFFSDNMNLTKNH